LDQPALFDNGLYLCDGVLLTQWEKRILVVVLVTMGYLKPKGEGRREKAAADMMEEDDMHVRAPERPATAVLAALRMLNQMKEVFPMTKQAGEVLHRGLTTVSIGWPNNPTHQQLLQSLLSAGFGALPACLRTAMSGFVADLEHLRLCGLDR
jgi:hypothetical protein